MAVLSNQQILDRLGDTVVIEPFNPANVNTSSYDVTLGEYYFIEHRPSWYRRWLRPVYNIWDKTAVDRVWGEPRRAAPSSRRLRSFPGLSRADQVILIPPKHTILAHTREFIGGRGDVTTMMKARSSFGRNFIEVCKCAGYGDVGYTNRWTMEITNNSRFYHIPMVVGRRVAQIVFMETGALCSGIGDYTEAGKYQTGTDVRELEMIWHPEMMLPRLDRDRDVLSPLACPHGARWDDCPDCRH